MIGPEPDNMESFEAFEEALYDTLTHLYDPAHRPAEILFRTLGCAQERGLEGIQEEIIAEVESLRPATYVPASARSRRLHGVLLYRYIQGLTQEEVAERLSITSRHLRREQLEAAHMLAAHLWDRRLSATSAERGFIVRDETEFPPHPGSSAVSSHQSTSQIEREVASLRGLAPAAEVDVADALIGVHRIASVLASPRGIDLRVQDVAPDIRALIHPAALRQIILAAVKQLVGAISTHAASSGTVTLGAERREEHISITITGRPVTPDSGLATDFVRELLAEYGGSVHITRDVDAVSFHIRAPSAGLTVLVVDDNAELIHLYQRYVLGTKYHIVHVGQGADVFNAVSINEPDLIVLDVMLPDVDGWELLVDLHEHSATRSIPIIVCSVVRGEDLALALGATRYLPKPVARQHFVSALDQALSRAGATGTTPPGNNAPTA